MVDLTETEKYLIALGGHFGRRAAEKAVTGRHPCEREAFPGLSVRGVRARNAGSVTIRFPDSDTDFDLNPREQDWALNKRRMTPQFSGQDDGSAPSPVPVALKTHYGYE